MRLRKSLNVIVKMNVRCNFMTVKNKLKTKKRNEFEAFELDMEYPHLTVGELDNGVCSVHNIMTGENFFNSKTI